MPAPTAAPNNIISNANSQPITGMDATARAAKAAITNKARLQEMQYTYFEILAPSSSL